MCRWHPLIIVVIVIVIVAAVMVMAMRQQWRCSLRTTPDELVLMRLRYVCLHFIYPLTTGYSDTLRRRR